MWSNEVLRDSAASLPDNKSLVRKGMGMIDMRDRHVVCGANEKGKTTGNNMRCFIVALPWTALGSRKSHISVHRFIFLFLTCDNIDGVLHCLRGPLIKIYIYLIYK